MKIELITVQGTFPIKVTIGQLWNLIASYTVDCYLTPQIFLPSYGPVMAAAFSVYCLEQIQCFVARQKKVESTHYLLYAVSSYIWDK